MMFVSNSALTQICLKYTPVKLLNLIRLYIGMGDKLRIKPLRLQTEVYVSAAVSLAYR